MFSPMYNYKFCSYKHNCKLFLTYKQQVVNNRKHHHFFGLPLGQATVPTFAHRALINKEQTFDSLHQFVSYFHQLSHTTK